MQRQIENLKKLIPEEVERNIKMLNNQLVKVIEILEESEKGITNEKTT